MTAPTPEGNTHAYPLTNTHTRTDAGESLVKHAQLLQGNSPRTGTAQRIVNYFKEETKLPTNKQVYASWIIE